MSGFVMRKEKKGKSAAGWSKVHSVRKKDHAGIPVQLRARWDALVYTQEMHSDGVARSTGVGHDHRASESSTGKRVAIIQRMRNNVVQRCKRNKGSNSSKKPNNAIQAYEVTTYEDFRNRSVVGDGLEGHEMWQHANLNARGYATSRMSTEASKKNPVMALPHDVHVQVNGAQSAINAGAQEPIDNIKANAAILYSHPTIPNAKVTEQFDAAIEHCNNTEKRRKNSG